jgi:hypothetical protein
MQCILAELTHCERGGGGCEREEQLIVVQCRLAGLTFCERGGGSEQERV